MWNIQTIKKKKRESKSEWMIDRKQRERELTFSYKSIQKWEKKIHLIISIKGIWLLAFLS